MKTPIPNPAGRTVKKGDQVKIETGELAGMIGEVVSFYDRGKNWVQTVKVIKDDGTVEFVEVTSVVISAVQIIEDFTKTNIFKKIAQFFKNLFKKKKPK
jgi:ribosomal protein L24